MALSRLCALRALGIFHNAPDGPRLPKMFPSHPNSLRARWNPRPQMFPTLFEHVGEKINS